MWTRRELKEQGKMAFRRSYWKSVLVSLLISIIIGGSISTTLGGNYMDSFVDGFDSQKQAISDEVDALREYERIVNEQIEGTRHRDETCDDVEEEETAEPIDNTASILQARGKIASSIVISVAYGLLFLLLMTGVVIVDIYVLNPVDVGGSRYFIQNQTHDARIQNVMYAFDHEWKQVSKTMFYYDLYRILWSLLFVLPGIYKSYEYRMVPYILAETPEMETREVFALSKDLMMGNKWEAFKLDMSFIGWNIIGIVTFGMAQVFYVAPYRNNVMAALYLKLKANYNNMGEQ